MVWFYFLLEAYYIAVIKLFLITGSKDGWLHLHICFNSISVMSSMLEINFFCGKQVLATKYLRW